MAERCQSWRYHPHAKHPVPPAPGQCRKCWGHCNKIAPEGSNRCDICLELLVTCPNPEIRRAIALEPNVRDDTLARLKEDHVYSVALTASNRIDERAMARGGPAAVAHYLNPLAGPTGPPPALPWAAR